MPKFRVTYEIVTPESAEHGDFAENGFQSKNYGIRVPLAEISDQWEIDLSLREAREYVWPIEDCGNWFAGSNQTLSYRDGSEITYSLHPPESITGASYGRLRRLFGIRG